MTAHQAPTISVIIPVYNTQAHLPACLDSVVGQTHEELEILLIDDGSTDRSAEICLRYAAGDPRIRVVQQQNGGVSSARNSGLEVATGEYVSLVDSDDWLEPSLYQEALEAMTASSADVVIFEYFVDTPSASIAHRDARSRYGVLDRSQAIELTIASQNSFAWSRLFTRAAIGESRFRTDLHWGEETLFVCEVLDRVDAAYHLDRPLYHYVQSPGSATRSGFGPRRLSGIDTALELRAFTESRYPHLATSADSFYGDILTQLLLEVWPDPQARALHARDLRSRLWGVLRKSGLARDVPLRTKARWLVAVMSTQALFFLRRRHVKQPRTRRRRVVM